MSKVIDNFLEYVKIHTTSDETSQTVPSTKLQLDFAKILVKQCKKIGLTDVLVDEHGYVTATIAANVNEAPTIGFIAHMDTAPDLSGENVKPQIVKNYDGSDIVLNKENDVILSSKDFPELNDYIGKDLITTDGTTLLGADDKAGVAEIMAACEHIINHPEIKHGKIRICFTPDEEIGRGADHFDVEGFGADFAYTMDGGQIGELEYENFNAAGAKIMIHGKNVHPGYAKNKMKNSLLIAAELINRLPKDEIPAKTSGYEGFYHVTNISGDVEATKLSMIIRDFDMHKFNKRKEDLQAIVDQLNNEYGERTIKLEIKEQYLNMLDKINDKKFIVDLAYKAMEACDVKPLVHPIRGGTDGARLSFMGLACPNIFAGGHNFHGRYEFIPTYAMEKAVEVIIKIVELAVK